MEIDYRKIAFILCVNDNLFFSECKKYIQRLTVPKGYSVEIVPVYGAQSMTAGYNKGMQLSNAGIKVYMHQDVFIINPNFINDVITIFGIDESIGMIGVIGSPSLPASGVQWHGEREGNLYFLDNNIGDRSESSFKLGMELTDVRAVDGLIMITRVDIPWRSDLFDGWDFYDSSQTMEFIKNGFRVVVPEQTKPWCIHEDGGVMNLWNYDKYRKIFLDEYAELL